MSRDEVDRALATLRDEKERIGSALLELEDHQGYRLLEGAALSGGTLRVREAVRGRMASLWALFHLYGGVLGAAEDLRARHGRPGQAQLAELTRLLVGESVELPAEEVPLERRTLLAAPGPERLTLRAAVERMNPLFEEVAREVAAVDAVWSVLLSRLSELDEARRHAATLLAALGGADPEYERLRLEVDAIATTVRADPLAFAREGAADTSRLDAAASALAALTRTLDEAVRLREGFAARIRAVRDTVQRLREAEAGARAARDEVLAKIASPVLPDLADASPALADRLDALAAPRGDPAAWSGLAARLDDLERAAGAALERARADEGVIRGLLDRRDELRGRLDAYRVKAARLGLAEDAELTRLYEHARTLLWTSPCDLRKATVTLSGYQQAINSSANGAG
ncbi:MULTISPECIES: hypothetical protein [Actinomadura]|uniref:Uncharacterized protein n=1 Tax=Actinomadura yumaensis TaxID=111807 RepID=A0ABW2CYD1_9ACTN|nr:hypothetical protein [Actinomadura sp. J1-007]MWK33317.1 hypothetical protein [Actinomadura sp. J1-007]